MIDVKIEGLENLERFFVGTSDVLRTKVLREGLKKAGRIIRKSARTNAPKASGLLRKQIKMVSLRAKKHMPISILVGITASAAKALRQEGKKRGAKPFWWIFQEYGWTDRAGRRHEGKAYLRRALLENKQAISQALRDHFQQHFLSEVAKSLHLLARARSV